MTFPNLTFSEVSWNITLRSLLTLIVSQTMKQVIVLVTLLILVAAGVRAEKPVSEHETGSICLAHPRSEPI